MFCRRFSIATFALLCAAAGYGNAQQRRPQSRPSTVEQRFDVVRRNPPELYAFLYAMPKGADLHNHLAGAIYAETFLTTAAQDHLCIDRHELAFVARPAATGECAA